jgi:hypothetical protein
MKTQLSELIKTKGGRYRGSPSSELGDGHSIIFNLYTGITFGKLRFNSRAGRRGYAVDVEADTPPGGARKSKESARVSFWESGRGGKRLVQGGLVGVLWVSAAGSNSKDGLAKRTSIYLGTISSTAKDLAMSCRESADRITISVSFFDTNAEIRMLRSLKSSSHGSKDMGGDSIFLIESPLLYESIRPFLQALCKEPASVPFARYLTYPESPTGNGSLKGLRIHPPIYTTQPGFKWNLSMLMRKEFRGVGCELDVMDESKKSEEACRRVLKECSRLDESQCDAVVDALTREVALIQGLVSSLVDG